MTLYDFRYLFVDNSQLVRIYDITSDKKVFEGEFENLPTELEDYEVMSIDTIYKIDFDGYITINIEMEDEDHDWLD